MISDQTVMKLLAKLHYADSVDDFELRQAIEDAEGHLRSRGWRRDSLTGAEWIQEGVRYEANNG